MKPSKNLPLYIALAIPVVLTLAIAATIYFPQLFAPKPAFNFIYSSADNYYPPYEFLVQNGKIIKKDIPVPQNQYDTPRSGTVRLFIQDVQINQSKEISLEEAQNLKISAEHFSPDGFEIFQGRNYNDGFFFLFYSYGDYNSVYIRGHGYGKKMNTVCTDKPYYGHPFQFVGWIL